MSEQPKPPVSYLDAILVERESNEYAMEGHGLDCLSPSDRPMGDAMHRLSVEATSKARAELAALRERVRELEAERETLRDKALRYDLDRAGIARRDQDAVELVEARARVRELEAEVERMRRRMVSIDEAEAWYSVRIYFPKVMLASMRIKVENWIVDEIARALEPERVHPDKRALRGEEASDG